MKKKIIARLKLYYCRFLVFCCKHQNVIIQMMEDGDELYGLCSPGFDLIHQWLDIFVLWFD